MKTILTFLLSTLTICMMSAQSAYVLPASRTSHISDRMYVLGLDRTRMSSVGNIEREWVGNAAWKLLLQEDSLSYLDKLDMQYLTRDNSEYLLFEADQSRAGNIKKVFTDSTSTFYYFESDEDNVKSFSENQKSGVFGLFYKDRANFYQINSDEFKLRANPILNISFGKDAEDDRPIIQNTRGAEIRGLIDSKVYFYTSIVDNQRSFLNYIENTIQQYDAIPGQGKYKIFNSSVLDNFSGYDYFDAIGYAGLDVSKHIALELGHGKHFIGNGMRSLLLSDSGDNYFYLKLNTHVWKLQYQNIFAELNSLSFRALSGDRLLTKKYMASHYLTFKPVESFEIGLFETVVFNRQNQFELQYLNPIILYRVIESGLGSPDNVLLGMNMSYTFAHHFQVYGQLVLDELKVSELKAGNGWWANKYGYQLGLKYYNALDIDHLDLQVEYNSVRPYTYSHGRPLEELPSYSNASYTHHSQPLAHPLGANFKEILGSARYQVSDKVFVHGRAMITKYGVDDTGDNIGQDILLINTSRNQDYGNEIGQGLKTDVMMMGLSVSYQPFHNYFIDINTIYRKSDSESATKQMDTKFVGVGLRVNMDREYNIDY